jgi:hypothetical protein
MVSVVPYAFFVRQVQRFDVVAFGQVAFCGSAPTLVVGLLNPSLVQLLLIGFNVLESVPKTAGVLVQAQWLRQNARRLDAL